MESFPLPASIVLTVLPPLLALKGCKLWEGKVSLPSAGFLAWICTPTPGGMPEPSRHRECLVVLGICLWIPQAGETQIRFRGPGLRIKKGVCVWIM